ncbi:MAG TPA: DNA-deoxyinosine glycosylase [Tepidisphaeraceae bacterium]|nr:DNA-deoxyinosine glycosylase [Tepidisphaeraceae bacterium]
MAQIECFAPIADEHTQILILGSMPGEESLKQGRYYANDRNSFWKIMGKIFEFDPQDHDHDREKVLLRKRVGLWDVLKSCDRQGSTDAAIKDEDINDFARFFAGHPAIRRVCLNGAKAADLFEKRVSPPLAGTYRLDLRRLPSTSPAHAMKFDAKLAEWKNAMQLKPGA